MISAAAASAGVWAGEGFSPSQRRLWKTTPKERSIGFNPAWNDHRFNHSGGVPPRFVYVSANIIGSGLRIEMPMRKKILSNKPVVNAITTPKTIARRTPQ